VPLPFKCPETPGSTVIEGFAEPLDDVYAAFDDMILIVETEFCVENVVPVAIE